MSVENKEYLSIQEVSKFTGISENTLRTYIKDGTGPPVSKLGRAKIKQIFRRIDVETWIENNKTKDNDDE